MAVFTDTGRVANALRFYSAHSSLYFGLGGSVAWENNAEYKADTGITDRTDNYPPTADSSSKMYYPIGLKKVQDYSICYKLAEGETPTGDTFMYRGETWVKVDSDQAEQDSHHPHHVFIRTVLTPLDNNSDVFTYRIIGIYSNPTFVSGVSSEELSFIEDAQIEDYGVLEFIDYRYPVIRQLDQTEYLSLMIEF